MHLTEEYSRPGLQQMSLGQRLRWYRTRRHLSQEALAEAIGVSPRSISRWEHDLAVPQHIYRERLSSVRVGASPLAGRSGPRRGAAASPH